jgi:hypothetical protein
MEKSRYKQLCTKKHHKPEQIGRSSATLNGNAMGNCAVSQESVIPYSTRKRNRDKTTTCSVGLLRRLGPGTCGGSCKANNVAENDYGRNLPRCVSMSHSRRHNSFPHVALSQKYTKRFARLCSADGFGVPRERGSSTIGGNVRSSIT